MSNDPEESDAVGGRTHTVGANVNIDTKAITDVTQKITTLTTSLAALNTALAKVNTGFSSTTSSMSSFGQKAGSIASSMFGTANEKGWVKDLLMFPTRYMRDNIQDNRNLALGASAALGPQAFGTATTTQRMMTSLAGQFGNVLGGSPSDLLNMVNVAGRVGAGLDWRYYGAGGTGPPGSQSSPRAAGFFKSVYEAQRINPGETVGNLAGSIGGYAGNVRAQQQSAFLTGGAFSMIGAGNRQKSISEWSEGILKWLTNLRPGGKRGQAFSYGELMSQNFPGSNIDAWLSANGVPDDMKQYFWAYAMAKSNAAPGTGPDQIFTKNAAVTESVAFNRLQATSAQTRTGFQLAGTMSGAYSNKEQANQWFAELTGHMLNQILPSAMSSGLLSYMQYLPDTIEEMIMQLAERTNLGSLGAGVVGWGSAIAPDLMGDVGDVGDFGSLGATSTAGLHPDMRKRVDAMMASNPRLRVTSGYRDLGTQQRLKRKGVGRVSGRPSAHTRGMAADLGPRSEYGWISKNARKFGLKSGRSHGEPWHVGFGDVGEGIEDFLANKVSTDSAANLGLSGMFGNLFSKLFGTISSPFRSDPEDQIMGLSGGISALLQALMGGFSSGAADPERLKYRNVYDLMVKGTNDAPGISSILAGAVGGGSSKWWDKITPGSGPYAGGPSAGVFGSKDAPASATDRAIAAAKVASHYWHGEDLLKAVAIAGRESSWSPWAHRTSVNPALLSGDRGLWQVNYENDAALIAAGMITDKRQLFDPEANARSAFWLYQRAGNTFAPWSMGPKGWEAGGDPMYRAKVDEAQTAISAAGVGDMESMVGYPGAPASVRVAPVNFFNNFTIQGGSGGNGSVDMRRTVAVIADQLEDEMRRRVARQN